MKKLSFKVFLFDKFSEYPNTKSKVRERAQVKFDPRFR